MKTKKIITSASALALLLAISCNKQETPTDDGSKTYIIISDIHLGDQRSVDAKYGWNLQMKDTLGVFLDFLKANKCCDELIVDGDMFEMWLAPPDTMTFADTKGNVQTESEYFQNVVNYNRVTFDKFTALKDSGVKLVYVPGNHDMQVTADDFNKVLPGLFTQARTEGVEGMGEYCPETEIFIEHGHRYDILNSPYIGKNGVDGIKGSIVPPGFFVTKLYCGFEHKEEETKVLDHVTYDVYWEALGAICGKEDIVTMTDGMTATYPFEDYATGKAKLFKGIDDLTEKNDGWKVRCERTKAVFVPGVTESILSGVIYDYCDQMGLEVLATKGFSPRILVWGHSHDPKFIPTEVNGEKRLYVNTGSWVDGEVAGAENTSTFCKITKSKDGKYTVSLCSFKVNPDGTGVVETLSTDTL